MGARKAEGTKGRCRPAAVAAAAAAVLTTLAAGAAPALARPTAWPVGSLTRVGQSDLSTKGASAVSLAAARNEVESFQIVVKADAAAALTGVSVGVTDLVGPNGAVIAARDIALFREHYVQVEATNTPGGKPGRYADALVPFRDPVTGRTPSNATIKAQNVTVEAGRDQPFWVDVPVPADATPGTYKGSWWARGTDGRVGGGPVEVEVWRATLPVMPTLRSSINQWSDHSLAADQALIANKVMPLWIDAGGARKLVGNSAINAAGLGFWSGAEDGVCQTGRPPSAAEIAQRAASFPKDLLRYNLTAQNVAGCDAAVTEALKAWGEALHTSGVASLVVGTPDPALTAPDAADQGRPAVDIWAVGPAAYRAAPDRVRAAIAAGAQVWGTTALADGASAPWLLDAAPANYRLLPGFTSQSLGFTGLLYWAADHWTREPWSDVTYKSADGESWPGEGILVYPGAPAGVTGVVPSVRLKWIRDGVEDYDLIALARAKGVQGLAKEIEAIAGRDWSGGTSDPAAIEAARRRIGEALNAR